MKLLSFLIISIAVIFFVSCGIEDIPLLAPPEIGNSNTVEYFYKFKETSANVNPAAAGSEFLGFELYYKFFDLIKYDQQGLDSTHLYIKTRSELESYGYRRIAHVTDTPIYINRPLLYVPSGNRGHASEITLFFFDFDRDLSPTTTSYITAESSDGGLEIPDPPTDPPFYLRRGGVVDEFGNLKDFSNYDPSDPDMVGLDLVTENVQAYLIVYVLSYGIYDFSVDLYSDALCLPKMTVNFSYVVPK